MLPMNQKFTPDQGPNIGTFEAALELASMDTFMGGLARDTAMGDMGGKKLSPEELNDKYQDVEVPFNKEMPEVAAFHLNEEGKKRRKLNEIISSGPKGTFYNQVVNLGAGIVAHATDPVEFGVGAFTGWGLRGLGAVAKGSQFTAFKKAGELLTNGGFAGEAAEGIIGNALLEPIMYGQSKRAQADYTLEDAFMSVVGGGLAAPMVKTGLQFGLGKFTQLPDSVTGLAIKNTVGQVLEGYKPTPEIHAKAYRDIALKNPVDTSQLGEVRNSYKFSPATVDEVSARPFYMAGDSLDRPKSIDDIFNITDNPNFANNIAAHPMDDSINDVFEVKLNEAKLVDYDTIKDTLKAANGDEVKVKAIMDELKTQGYDGIMKSDAEAGHNAVHIFDESKAKVTESSRFKSDPKSVPSISPEEVEKIRNAARARENQIGFDSQVDKEFNDFILPDELKSADSSKIDAEMDETLKTFDGMDKEGMLSSASKEALEQVKMSKQKRQSIPEIASDFFNCLINGGAA